MTKALSDGDSDIDNRQQTITPAQLDELVKRGTEAFRHGDFEKAMRRFDRVWRYSPDNFLVGEFLGRLLVACGHNDAAMRHLTALTARWPSPDTEASLIECLLRLDRWEAAFARLQPALNRFAVAPGATLAEAAEKTVAAAPARPCGWLALDPELQLVGGVVGLSASEFVEIAADGETIFLDRAPRGATGFLLHHVLPELRGGSVLSLRARGRALFGGVDYLPRFALDGRASLKGDHIVGWASLGWLPDASLELVATDERGAVAALATARDAGLPLRRCFDFDPRAVGLYGGQICIAARMPDKSMASLPDSPLLIVISPAPQRAGKRPRRRASITEDTAQMTVDIIVPVYGGRDETIECLESVLATKGPRAELVVVDDASPDAAMVAQLIRLARQGLITLLRNERNLGFPASCNRGINLHADRDVVLLNADAVVYSDWLDRLRTAAYSSGDVGSVTPLSNVGSIVSYPGGTEWDCDGDTAESIDALAASVNRGVAVDLPVGVGFCLYLRRDCIAEIGPLDEETFASGYGEEVDFCLRAAERHWRHLLAANLFVRHAGSRSFGDRRAALLDRSAAIINRRYPAFKKQVDDFHTRDTLGPIRRKLDEARLKALPARHAVLVTLALNGGVERFVRERCEQLRAEGVRPLVVKPALEDFDICLLETPGDGPNDLRFRLPEEAEELHRLLAGIDVTIVEIHHFLDVAPELIEAILKLGAPVDVYIHDYSWICPRITLIDATHQYCGEPKLAICERCIRENGARLTAPATVAELRKRSQRWLSQARQVFAPTRDAAQRLARYFPDLKVKIMPWEAVSEATPALRSDPPDIVRVALIGAIGVHKGYEILRACARDAYARRLPLEFVVLGYTENDEEICDDGNVFVTGRYDDSELAGLLERESPDVVFFPSVWPEIWCYALTPALRAGLRVVAFDIGAMAERLRDYSCGVLLPLTGDPVTLNSLLLKTGREVGTTEQLQGGNFGKAVVSLSTRQDGFYRSPRSDLMPTLNTVTATVQILPVSDGLYAFSVSEGAPGRAAALDNLLLPAIHVGLGPGVSSNLVEFIAGPTTHGAWLCKVGDIVIAKITGSVTILLTSLQSTTGQALAIDVEKLDGRKSVDKPAEAQLVASQLQAAKIQEPAVTSAAEPEPSSVPLEMKLHIRNLGDSSFLNADWAGRSGSGKWIEAFSVLPSGELGRADIEYKGLSATGIETPWLSNGNDCGTRGKATPLLGFAIRLKANGSAAQFNCEYSGYFSSGTVIGPLKNGTPCRSTLKNDPLEGIQIRVTRRKEGGVQNARPAAGPGTGPRFSKLREDNEEQVVARRLERPGRKSAPGRAATDRPGRPAAERPGRPAERPERPAAERPGRPAERPERPAAERPGRPAERPERPAAERPGRPAAERPGRPAERLAPMPQVAATGPVDDTTWTLPEPPHPKHARRVRPIAPAQGAPEPADRLQHPARARPIVGAGRKE